ncbi:GNAT family N-acetyltransferase [bacterium]|nr:GNAT family N-acetyltransferase [bacterium]
MALKQAGDSHFRPDPMRIRRGTVQDAETVAALQVAIHDSHVQSRPDVFKPLAMTDELIDFTAERLSNPDCVVFIGEVSNRAIGHALVMLVRRPENVFTYEQVYALVDQIGIEPAYRGLGYGELLMRRVVDFAQEQRIPQVRLSVWTFNEGAIDFYERLGFRIHMHQMELLLG